MRVHVQPGVGVLKSRCTSSIAVFALCLGISACRIAIITPGGGDVTTTSGAYTCAAGETCLIEVADDKFEETFLAAPLADHDFAGWKKREKGLCGGSRRPCSLNTAGFLDHPVL